MTTLAVLGGSSPYTIGLVNALRDAPQRLAAGTLVLHGRSRSALDLVGRYAVHQLAPFGWEVRTSSDTRAALEGADVVVHQIRYGGLEERERDEHFARSLGVVADETLGPAGLRAALRSAQPVKELAELIRHVCPSAWLINLTNPLSVTTALFAHFGVARALGVCELPTFTHAAVAARLGVQVKDLSWQYIGLNHRGFIYDLQVDGRPVLGQFLERLGASAFEGISASDIALLQAIPLKYFKLVRDPRPAGGRATALMALRAELLFELAADHTRTPDSMAQRYMPWYEAAVVPLLFGLQSDSPASHVVNVPSGRIAVECHATVSRHGVAEAPRLRSPSAAVEAWIERFTSHELSLVRATLDPTHAAIHEALARDPLLSPEAAVLGARLISSQPTEIG